MAKWEQSGGSYVAMTFVANKGGTVKSIMAKIENNNGANVKMFTQCMTDTDAPYLRAAPLSDKAKKYVTDLFRTKKAVIVNRGAMVEKMPVSAVGFLDAWNSSGGDAI
ncbi:hypothetical protein H735_04885 [Vibrio owensii CAIM 1854 = LMG 25443]|uniref:Uncharacterized protein n=1 Tax=Vibrio owensii CAIM 1854 = LMG 25443 TaxID=1229493 RepID=A0A0C1ZBC2_9VIBR|nr:hypothetical protein H735_04885 [Vibrio owensii CAIM 1854 = LMG 25443]